MQLLYGNDGINYHTIAKSKGITSVQESRLLDGYLGYSFVNDRQKYSSGYDEPVAISYATTNLGNTLPAEMILLSKSARMTNYRASSYYSHFHLIETSEKMYGEAFFELLGYSFIRDIDVNDYLIKDIDSFVPQKGNELPPIKRDAVGKEKLLPIVAAIMNVADSMSNRVCLVLDVEGDAYNRRALEVIAALYTYLPYTIRKKAGFSTYAGVSSSASARIKLQLYTRDILNKTKYGLIDLANVNSEEILRGIPDDIVSLASLFIESDISERKSLFETFQMVFGMNPATVEEHIIFYRNIMRWKNDSFEEMKDELARYANSEMQREEKTPDFKMFQLIVSQRVRDEHLDSRYQELIGEMLKDQKSFGFAPKLRAYIMLGEALEGLEFDIEMFLRWEQDVIIAEAERQYEDAELYRYLQKHLKKLYSAQIGGVKYKEVITAMDRLLSKRLYTLEEEIRERTNRERRNNLALPARQGLGSLNPADISFVEIIDRKGRIAKALEGCKNIVWNKKQDILSTYENLSITRAAFRDCSIEDMNCRLKIGVKEYILTVKELTGLIEILLCPEGGEQGEFGRIIYNQADIIQNLFEIRALGEEHFKLLLNTVGRREQAQTLNCYLKGGAMLSEEDIEESLERVDGRILLEASNGTVPNNILGLVLKKRMKRAEAADQKYEDEGEDEDLEPMGDSVGSFVGAMIAAIMFLTGAFLKVRVSAGIMVPCGLTIAGVFIFIVFCVIYYWASDSIDEVRLGSVLGGMLGGIASIFTAWMAWLII